MKAEVLSKFNQPWLPVLAQLLFLAVFLGVIFYAYRKKNQTLFELQSMLPLSEDTKKDVTHE